jgi:hypothetical protein
VRRILARTTRRVLFRDDLSPERDDHTTRFSSNVQGGAGMAYIIAEPCIGTKDAACVNVVCPVDCILLVNLQGKSGILVETRNEQN